MTNKLFAKFDLGFVDNAKIIGLSDAAFRAYVESIVYARQHLTDGFLDFRVVARKWNSEVVQELTTNDPTNPSWKPAKNGLQEGFQIHDFAVHQTTKADIADIRDARSAAGKRGAQAKAKQSSSKSEANDFGLLSKTKPETETETETETEKNLTPNHSDLFESFWNEYPRRVGKESARKAFLKAMKRSEPNEIIAGAVRLGQDPNLPDMQFVPHPATWLNRDGWEDEPYPAKAQPAVGYQTPALPQPPKISDIYCEKHYGYPRGNCDRCSEDI